MKEQVISFKYLGVETSNGAVQSEVKHQAYKGTACTAKCGEIKYLSLEPNAVTCKSVVRRVQRTQGLAPPGNNRNEYRKGNSGERRIDHVL
jgi:hypothetical protein